MTTHPYQNHTTQDTLVLQHRLKQAAEENRLTYLADPGGDNFIGHITTADEEDCYLVVNRAKKIRRIELSQVSRVKLIVGNQVRIELF